MRTTAWDSQKLRAILVLTLAVSFQLLLCPPVLGIVGDKAEVSPGKIPPTGRDHYLGNSSFLVKLEYPRSFILQETVGDLLFNITLNGSVTLNRTRIDIYIPPEFRVTTNCTYVWSTITNNYANIGFSRLSSIDRTAPNWYRVYGRPYDLVVLVRSVTGHVVALHSCRYAEFLIESLSEKVQRTRRLTEGHIFNVPGRHCHGCGNQACGHARTRRIGHLTTLRDEDFQSDLDLFLRTLPSTMKKATDCLIQELMSDALLARGAKP